MSKGKEFPPRVWRYKPHRKNGTVRYIENPALADYIAESVPYVPESLLAEARREGRAEAFREVAQQMRRESGFQHAQKRADYYEAKAAEGAIDG